jgi:hypothetical protein
MRGWALINGSPNLSSKDRKDWTIKARALYEQALALDPNNPGGLAGTAFTYMVEYMSDGEIPGSITTPKYSVRQTGPSRSIQTTTSRIG